MIIPFLRYGDLLVENHKCSSHLSYLLPSVEIISLVFVEKFYGSWWQILCGPDIEDFVILACVLLTGQQSVTDGRTDRRTDAKLP